MKTNYFSEILVWTLTSLLLLAGVMAAEAGVINLVDSLATEYPIVKGME